MPIALRHTQHLSRLLSHQRGRGALRRGGEPALLSLSPWGVGVEPCAKAGSTAPLTASAWSPVGVQPCAAACSPAPLAASAWSPVGAEPCAGAGSPAPLAASAWGPVGVQPCAGAGSPAPLAAPAWTPVGVEPCAGAESPAPLPVSAGGPARAALADASCEGSAMVRGSWQGGARKLAGLVAADGRTVHAVNCAQPLG